MYVITGALSALAILAIFVILSWVILGPLALIERAAADWFREGIRILRTEGLEAEREHNARPPWYVRFVDKNYRR